MVFRGKPSKGCESCRRRRVKCDQIPLPNGCSQCWKTGRRCPGYRDLNQVVFHDVTAATTDAVQRRVQTAVATRRQPRACKDISQSYEKSESHGVATGSISFAIAPLPENQALAFFHSALYNHAVFAPANPSEHAETPSDIWSRGVNEPLKSGMQTVGLAGLYRETKNPLFERLAHRNYCEAIQKTNEALSSPIECRRDSTLLTVIILGLSEGIIGERGQYLRNLDYHTTGAGILVALRGTGQFASATGCRMFLQIATNLLISHLQKNTALSKEIRNLMHHLSRSSYIDTGSGHWKLLEIMVVVADFRARYRLREARDSMAIFERSMQLDLEIAQVVNNIPPSSHFELVSTSNDPEIAPNGYYHVYKDYWQSQLFNSIRICRLLLHDMARKALLRGIAHHPPIFKDDEYATYAALTAQISSKLQFEVQASVPQNIGYITAIKDLSSLAIAQPGTGDRELPPGSRLTKELLLARLGRLPSPWVDFSMEATDIAMWPHIPIVRTHSSSLMCWALYLAGLGAPPVMRKWIIVVLSYIGEAMGLTEANALGDLLSGP